MKVRLIYRDGDSEEIYEVYRIEVLQDEDYWDDEEILEGELEDDCES